ncbi:hypothetical protein PT974_05188 [Cladobotryum mycophilum]|uniref:Uncharacterized protein n=1 Tax=Cladobotryum mycophilum TaxID=491253 RepID=A0ABR0SRA8_9HYPO
MSGNSAPPTSGREDGSYSSIEEPLLPAPPSTLLPQSSPFPKSDEGPGLDEASHREVSARLEQVSKRLSEVAIEYDEEPLYQHVKLGVTLHLTPEEDAIMSLQDLKIDVRDDAASVVTTIVASGQGIFTDDPSAIF